MSCQCGCGVSSHGSQRDRGGGELGDGLELVQAVEGLDPAKRTHLEGEEARERVVVGERDAA